MRLRSLLHLALRALPVASLTICLLLPALATAQTHDLSVVVHDAGGRGVAGITIIVRTDVGQALARQVTDVAGSARFVELPAVVRVAVVGQARGGPQLYQLGDDGDGIRLKLGFASGTASLALRVERDGLVLPDPATMLSLEEGGPTVAQAPVLPSAVVATAAPRASTSTNDSSGVVRVGEAPALGDQHRADWVPPVTLLLVVAALCVLRLVQQLRGTR